ncbi:MAG: adenylate/guanylate cyclase domain-containing protein [Actinomycetota bacterium]
MAKLISHVITYVAVMALVIAIWVMVGGGSPEQLREIADNPSTAISAGFWPIWPILGWGTLLVIHAGSTLSHFLFGWMDRREREKRKQQRIEAARKPLDMAIGAAETGRDIVREVAAAIEKAHEARPARDRRRRGPRSRRRPPGFPATPGMAAEDVPPMEPQRKWVTVMFTDIADSTSHNERLGDDEWRRILLDMRTLVRNAIADRNGSEVGTAGDGLLARFASPADAVLCGVDIQGELTQARTTSEFVPEVRIGIHAGEAVEEDGDLVGRVINLASRVTDEASPGEILVTEPVADQLIGKLELEDKGLRELKGLAQPRHLLAVRWSEGD